MRTGYRLSLALAGCCVLAIVLSPPLHELSERWFSAHMIEHELLMAVAAVLKSLAATTGVDITAMLADQTGSNGTALITKKEVRA